MASIKIRKTVPVYSSEKQSYDITVEALEAADMPLEIFVFKRGTPVLPAPGGTAPATEPEDIFISIADPVDLEEYPVNGPDMAKSNPYFRLAKVTIRMRSVLDLEHLWQYITEDVQGLVDALNSSELPGSSEEITFS